MFWDAGGHWHSGSRAAQYDEGLDAWLELVLTYTYNVVYMDWHAKAAVPEGVFRKHYCGV